MSFKSKASKQQAQSTVNRLFANVLPGSTIVDQAQSKITKTSNSNSNKNQNQNQKKNKLSSTELLNNHLSNKHKLTPEEIRKLNKQNKHKQNKLINKKLEETKKFNKLIKYNIIKNHKSENQLTVEESKYLKKLIKKNSNSINRLSEIDDPEINEELDQIKQEILQISNDKYNKAKRYKENKISQKQIDFNEKVKSGDISVPGLTPGLAPVGYDDDSDDE